MGQTTPPAQVGSNDVLGALVQRPASLSREAVDDPTVIDAAEELLRAFAEEEASACERVVTRQRLRRMVAGTLRPLPDDVVKQIANNMPGGLDGFCKGWGWLQFARASEEAHGISDF